MEELAKQFEDTLNIGPSKNVVIIHEPKQQQHQPAQDFGLFELPVRIVAIESSLRGYRFNSIQPAEGVVRVEKHEISENLFGKSSPAKGVEEEIASAALSYVSNASLVELFEGENAVHTKGIVNDSNWQPALHRKPAKPNSLWLKCEIRRAPMASLDVLLLCHEESHLKAVARKTLGMRFCVLSLL